MWFSIFEMFPTPLVLFAISFHALNKDSTDPPSKTSVESLNGISANNESECPSFHPKSKGNLLFYDDPNPNIRGCYEERSQGPCSENMKLYPKVEGSRHGVCDCDTSSTRLMLFHNATNKCYPIFHQAFCKHGEQLTIRRENVLEPVCARTVCHDDILKPENYGKDLVPVGGECAEVGSKCTKCNCKFCTLEISFVPRKVTPPTCCSANTPSKLDRAIGVPPLPCSPGTYKAINGKCQPPILSFDDDF